jgi:hypothetical protein
MYNPVTNVWTPSPAGNTPNSHGTYPSPLLPGQPGTPGARGGSAAWSDGMGNLWLFGGAGYASVAGAPSGLLNDLWKFTPSSNGNGQWTYEAGSNLTNQAGVYGTQKVFAPTNVPGARNFPSSWVQSAVVNGSQTYNLWLFGGASNATPPPIIQPFFNDLWEFAPQ